jgi:hypothetical protein
VLTNRPAEKPSAFWSVLRVGVALVLSAGTFASADAGGVGTLTCLRGAASLSCAAQWATAGDPYVRTVPEVLGEEEKARAEARDQKWLSHCRPVVKHDAYGVARYQYATPGCEYGFGGD